MFDNNRSPAWFRDSKWLSGILLVVVLAASILSFSLTQLTTANRAKLVLERVIELTLLPEGVGQGLAVRQGIDFELGDRLQLLPGVEVFADPTEIEGLTTEDAQSRVAAVLAERVVSAGTAAALALVTDGDLTAQLERAFVGPVPFLTRLWLGASMMPLGLEDGSRLAQWEVQAAEQPGQPVQPVVGVFVLVEPERLRPLSEREIGELVVRELASTVLAEGLPAAQELVTSSTLLQQLSLTIQGEVRSSLHDLFITLLLSRGETVSVRLKQSRAALAEVDPPDAIPGVLPASRLEGLSPEEADRVVLSVLAEQAFAEGVEVVADQVIDVEQASRLQSVAGVVDRLTRAAHRRYLQITWWTGTLALLFLAGLMVFSRGLGRLVNPGLALMLAAGPGAVLFTWLNGLLESAVEILPASIRTTGAIAFLGDLLGYIGARLPIEVFDLLSRNHLIVLLVGAGLVALALLVRLGQLLRPRRRTLL